MRKTLRTYDYVYYKGDEEIPEDEYLVIEVGKNGFMQDVCLNKYPIKYNKIIESSDVRNNRMIKEEHKENKRILKNYALRHHKS